MIRKKTCICLALLVIFSSPIWLFGEKKPVKRGKKEPTSFQRVKAPFRKSHSFAPGNRFLILRKWRHPNVIWFWIHNDEYSAKKNTYWAYRHFGGFAFFFLNPGNKYRRNLSFYVPRYHRSFVLDPNRIFQKQGIRDNLLLLNSSRYVKKYPTRITNYAWTHVGKKAQNILLRYWTKNRPLIALHNNRYLSTSKYREDPKNFEIAEFLNTPTSSFVFVLTREHFEKLSACGVNTIYQKSSQKDGSLSDLAIERGLPYVNIETRIRYTDEQRKIIEKVVYTLFPKQFPEKYFSQPPC